MSPSRRKQRQTEARQHARPGIRWLAGLLLIGVAIVVASAFRGNDKSLPSQPPSPAPNKVAVKAAAPPAPVSPFLNTRPDARYVGTQACTECHQEQHASFQHTGMSRSLATADVSREPPDAEFDHAASGRRYQVRRRDGQMWHRELLLGADPVEVLLQEFPVKYVTGSGRHSLTYVAEADGFLVESPITWYASKVAWGMSPGYDRPEHSGFQREVGESCLICHAGRIETLDRSLHRVRVIEEAIGCERCHGPGSLHLERRSTTKTPGADASGSREAESIDYTIVNPAHLSRDLAEAVCQQCHLRVSATVFVRGKDAADFRPGLPLTVFRRDYSLESADKLMTVVGHVEQMHKSACYQGSSTFTCVTCHNPHGEPPPDERTAYYQRICLGCHKAEHCTVDPARRERESADNQCLVCHMPTTPTDIPHLAFTHHRVGIHDHSADARPNDKETKSRPGSLQPFIKGLPGSEIEEPRLLGLAYFDLAQHERNSSLREHYQRESRRILNDVSAAGQADGVVSASLASLNFDLGLDGHGALASRALADPTLSGLPRCNALFLLADSQFEAGRYPDALSSLDSLNRLRRNSVQWLLAAECQKKLNNPADAAAALRQAATIDPGLTDVHKHLANIYRQQGDEERARFHEQRSGR